MKTAASNFLLATSTLFFNSPLLVAASGSCPKVVTSHDDCSAAIFSGSGSIVTTCTEDNKLTVSGSFSTINVFDADVTILAVPCLMGTICFRKYGQEIGSLCDIATNDAGAECGTAGSYTLNEVSAYDLPDGSMSSVYGSVTIKLLANDDEECEGGKFMQRFQSSSNLGMSVVPVVGVMGLVSYMRRSRSRRPILNLEGGDEQFVEMNDLQSSGTMV